MLEEIITLQQQVIDAQSKLRSLVLGKRAKYLTNFNGHPFGNSRKSLNGKEFIVRQAFIGDTGKAWIWDGDSRNAPVEAYQVEIFED